MSTVLEQICAEKRRLVADRKASLSAPDLRARCEDSSPTRGFIKSLLFRSDAGRPALIAEIKKASPSKGVIRSDFDPASLARAYEAGGAACLSVLTDTPYFQGCDEDLIQARGACLLPVLRKDFLVDPWQVLESRSLGADCILLILAALTDDLAAEMMALARQLGLDVLTEVHDEDELERAAQLGARMIGVNSRDLKTLVVDPQTPHRLAPLFPEGALRVAESGIGSHEDVIALQQAGYQAFLVGESLMRQGDLTRATRRLLTGED